MAYFWQNKMFLGNQLKLVQVIITMKRLYDHVDLKHTGTYKQYLKNRLSLKIEKKNPLQELRKSKANWVLWENEDKQTKQANKE